MSFTTVYMEGRKLIPHYMKRLVNFCLLIHFCSERKINYYSLYSMDFGDESITD